MTLKANAMTNVKHGFDLKLILNTKTLAPKQRQLIASTLSLYPYVT